MLGKAARLLLQSREESQECCPAVGVLFMAHSTGSRTRLHSPQPLQISKCSPNKFGVVPHAGANCAPLRPTKDLYPLVGMGSGS